MEPKVHGVICYWEYVTPKNRESPWVLKESYGTDDDGYALTKASTGVGRSEWSKWMRNPETQEEYKGRAVTGWNMGSGVFLMDFLPLERVPWLSPHFYEALTKHSDWAIVLNHGYDLYFKTQAEARRILDQKSNSKAS
jgi:hypothetical protein